MLPRHAHRQLLDGLGDTPIVYLQGPRQSGKSTLAQSLQEPLSGAPYLTLDTAAVLAAATEDPEGLVAGLPQAAIIDEVQRAPALALAIKAAVDADRRPGRFLLTGSAGVLSLPRLADSLAGRMELHTLWPFSQGELAEVRETFIDRMFVEGPKAGDTPTATGNDLVGRICLGGFPEIHARKSWPRRRAWFDAYIDTIVQRDLRDIANVERLSELPRLLGLLASRACQLVNFADLSRALAVPQSTLKRYVALLETTFLVRLLPAWFTNVGKRLTKAPKLLLTDTGLLMHVLGADADRLRRDRLLFGHALENFVAMELIKQLGWCERRCELFHFRTPAGAEVDLVLEDRAGNLVGIEVKSAASLRRRDFRGLEVLAELAGPRFVRGVVLYTGAQIVPFGENLHAVPIGEAFA